MVAPFPIDPDPGGFVLPAHARDWHWPSGSLPIPPTALVGREGTVDEVVGLLRRDDVRLVTLVGPGGVGKTSLAQVAAATAASEFRDGVVFVDLAPIREPTMVPVAIAQALSVREMPGQSLPDALAAALGQRHILLVLDNLEQVIAAAPTIATLLAHGPGLTVLATSRAPLNVRAEYGYPVAPLTIPDPDRASVEALAANPAVALFVERAQAIEPGFALGEDNAAILAEICRRLDGLPLAIELAAARLRVLPLPALLARITNRLTLLTSGARDYPERSRTIRATVAWSHDLLSATEQVVFRRLGVFAGGFTLSAAECVVTTAVATGDTAENVADPALEVLEGVASLVEQSLLVRRPDQGGEPRFGMLETIREYALERLVESGEVDAAKRAHATTYLDIAERAEAGFFAGADLPWLDLFASEHDNFRAALAWCLDRREIATAQRFTALTPFWFIRGHLTEGRAWTERILALDTQSTTLERAQALFGAAQIARGQGDVERGTALQSEALSIRRSAGHERGVAISLFMLGDLAIEAADDDRALELHTEALERCRAVGGLDFCVAAGLWQLGTIADRRGDESTAMAAYTESLALARRTGGRWVASFVLSSLGVAAFTRGDVPRAIDLLRESVLSCWEIGDRWALAYALVSLAEILVTGGDHERAARFFGAAEALREAGNMPLMRFTLTGYETALDAIQTHLTPTRRAHAWAAGRTLPLVRIIQEVIDLTTDAPAPAPAPGAPVVTPPAASSLPGGLTERELDVLRLLATGLPNAAIAERLFLSRRTVDAHLQRIYSKLDVNSRSAATRLALDLGLA